MYGIGKKDEELVKETIRYVFANQERFLALAQQKQIEAKILSTVQQLREIRDFGFITKLESNQIDRMIWRLENREDNDV